MRHRIGILCLIFACLLPPRATQAQPAAAPPAPPPPPPLREGSAEFAFVGTSGNSETETIGLGGEFIYRPAPWETRVKLNYVRNEADDVLKAQAFVLAGRVQRALNPRLSAYGQYGYQRDRFAGILNRNAIDGGLAYLLIDQKPHKLIVDGSAGYAHEDRLVGDNLSTATASGGALYALAISATSQLTEDGHIVASLSNGDDWRYTNVLGLTAKVSTRVSLKVSNTIRYLNFPIDDFKKTDVITAIALVAKF